MPYLARAFIRASLLYLGIGFTFGALMLANKGVQLNPGLWRLLPAHIEFLLIGWTLQFIMGMAYWILPRFGAQGVRGREPAAWAAFALLNVGVLLAGLAPVLGSSGLMLIGRSAEVGAVLAFVVHAWPRVKPLSSRS